MHALKLDALDADDLEVISAQVQDAVLKVGDLKWLPREKRFVIGMNRFAWDKVAANGGGAERRRAVLYFDRVLSVKACRIRCEAKDAVLNLLAIRFTETDPPSGLVELFFSGGGIVRLEVECIEARLADLGAAWVARSMPVHQLEA